jgi:hypothetical protein
MPKILSLTIFDFTTWLNVAPINKKRHEAKGHPCLTPCKIGKNCVVAPNFLDFKAHACHL